MPLELRSAFKGLWNLAFLRTCRGLECTDWSRGTAVRLLLTTREISSPQDCLRTDTLLTTVTAVLLELHTPILP